MTNLPSIGIAPIQAKVPGPRWLKTSGLPTITVELPRETVDIDLRSVGELASDLRLLMIIDRVRAGQISAVKGVKLAGIDRWSFTRTMGEHGVPVIAYSAEVLRNEVATLDTL